MKDRFLRNMHLVLWALCVAFYAYQYGIRSVIPSVLNEDLRQYFAINSTEMGSLIGIFYISYMLMQIPVGLLIDRFSAKKICLSAFALVSFFTISFVYTNNYTIAAASRFFLGCCCSFAFVLIIKISNDYFPREKVAFVSSIAISIGSFGPIIMNPLLAHMSEVFPWRNVVFGIGFFGFAMSLLGLFAVHEKKLPTINSLENDEKCGAEQEKENEIRGWNKIWADLKIIFSNSQYLWIGLFSMAVLGPMSTFCDAWGLSFLKEAYDLDKEQASFLIANMYFAEIFGAPLVAIVAGKMQSYKKVMVGGSLLLIALFSCIIFIKMPLYMLSILLFCTGIIATCQFLSFPAALVGTSKKIGATVTGAVNTLTMLGSTLLIPIVGKIMDFSRGKLGDPSEIVVKYSVQDYRTGLCALLFFLCIALCSTIFVKDTYK